MKIIFYKIKSLDDNKCYVGSTNNLRLRMNKHKQDYKNYLKDNTVKVKVCTSIEILKNNYEIIILEEIEYETLEDLKNRYIKERYYIENSENVVNKQIPSMTVAERKRIYYKNNKQKILERQNAYYKDENKRMRMINYSRARHQKKKALPRFIRGERGDPVKSLANPPF